MIILYDCNQYLYTKTVWIHIYLVPVNIYSIEGSIYLSKIKHKVHTFDLMAETLAVPV